VAYTFEVLFKPKVEYTGRAQALITSDYGAHSINLYSTAFAIDQRVAYDGKTARIRIVDLTKGFVFYHAVFTAESGIGAKFYLDGEFKGKFNFTEDLAVTHVPIKIGTQFPGKWYGYVDIAVVRIYNRVLTEEEITAHYRYLKQAVRGL